MGAHHEQGGIIALLAARQQAAGDHIAQVVQLRVALAAKEPGEMSHAVPQVSVRRRDEAVGVENEQALVGNRQLGELKWRLGHAQRRIGGIRGESDGAVGAHQGERRVAGAGHGAGARDGIVDRVQAGGEAILAEPVDQFIQVAEDLIGRQLEVGQGLHGGAQPPHDDRLRQSVAHDVADDQGNAVGGERDDVVPVAADGRVRAGREIPGGGGHRGQRREYLGEQRSL